MPHRALEVGRKKKNKEFMYLKRNTFDNNLKYVYVPTFQFYLQKIISVLDYIFVYIYNSSKKFYELILSGIYKIE